MNAQKTKYIVFSYRGQFEFHGLIELGGDAIVRADYVKFLGIMLGSKLNFSNHVYYISDKISRSIGILFRVRDFLPLNPYILYGIEAWYNAPDYLRNKIYILQKKAIRAMNHLNYLDHSVHCFREMKTLPIDFVFRSRIVTYVYRTMESDEILSSRLDFLCDVHMHNTRSTNLFVIPLFRKEKSKAHVHLTGVREWNLLPENIKEISALSSFRNKVREYFLTKV